MKKSKEHHKTSLAKILPLVESLPQADKFQPLQKRNKVKSRPDKCLDYRTPYEEFEKLTGLNIRKIMGYALIT